MSDPRRLLDDIDDLSPAERSALLAARGERPPSEAVDGAWSGLLAKIPMAGPAGAGAAGSSASAAPIGGGAAGGGAASVATGAAIGTGTAAAIKAAVIGAAFGAIALTGRAVLSSRPASIASTPATIASVVTPPMVTGAALPASPIEPAKIGPQPNEINEGAIPNGVNAIDPKIVEPMARAVLGPGRRSSDDPGKSPTGDETRSSLVAAGEAPRAAPARAPAAVAGEAREETRLVASAREALRAGRWSEGSALLDQAGRRFPNGILLQEREALAIEALVQGGQRPRAIERAHAFFRAHPESPHAARIRAVIAGP